jgi:hypothetical protein
LGRQRAEVARQAAEIDRLRAENRALLNSILGVAGIPPIQIGLPDSRLGEPGRSDTIFMPPSPASGHSESPTHSRGGDDSLSRPTSSSPQTAPHSDSSSRQSGTRNDSSPSPTSPARQLAAPSTLSPIRRRRSWHQINRMLELESARKPVIGEK